MTARIGRVYSRTGEGQPMNQQSSLSATDGRPHFINPRERLRDRVGTAVLVLAWAAAILGLIATFWSVL